MSFNIPVRDELVVHLDGTLPELKSSRGIPVVKHTKRGQNENRRLRLDTDLSTLEVFSANTGYLNRRMSTRTHNLSLLEEVGPATSVPGGLPATPGRTLLFVFRNRRLYVTVKSRDVGAALVALFRGGPLSHGYAPSLGPAIGQGQGLRAGEDATGSTGSRKMQQSPSTSSPASSCASSRVSRSRDRRSEGHSGSARAREERSSVGANARTRSGGSRRNEGGSDYGTARGGSVHRMLKRSASCSGGPDSFTSTSSSDDDLLVQATLQATPPLSGTSGRSPVSTQSSESPDPVMSARVVGFGSADAANESKSRRGRSVPNFKNPLSRRLDGERKVTPPPASVAPSSVDSSGLETGITTHHVTSGPEGKALVVEGKILPPEISAATETIDALDADVHSPVVINGAMGESLRRPASAASAGTLGSESPPTFTVRGDEAPSRAAGAGTGSVRTRSKTSTSPIGRVGKSTAVGAQQRKGNALDNAMPAAQQQQLPAASPLQKVVNNFSFGTPIRPGSPRLLRGRQQALLRRDHGDYGSELRIPQLRRPVADPKWPPRESDEQGPALYHDSADESVSPIRRVYCREAKAGEARLAAVAQPSIGSSSFDSLDAEGPYRVQGRANVEGSTSYSEGEDDGRIGIPAPASREVESAVSRGMSRPRHEGGPAGGNPPPTAEVFIPAEMRGPFGNPRVGHESILTGRDGLGLVDNSLHLNTHGVETVETTESIEAVGAMESGPPFGPEPLDAVVGQLTIEADSPHDPILPTAVGKPVRELLPFSTAQPANILAPLSSRSRGSRHSCGSRGSRGTDCTSPDSPPGGAVGEVRATISNLTGPRGMPLMRGLHVTNGVPQEPKGPSGFEELWAVLEPAWGINFSFGTSMAPKVMLLGEIYQAMRTFQTAVAEVCVRACGPALGDVCGRCGRAWAVLSSASPQAIAEFPTRQKKKIEEGIAQLIVLVNQYGAGAVVRRFTLTLVRDGGSAWGEMLSAGEGADLQGPCRQIEEAIALLPNEGREGAAPTSTGGGEGGEGGSVAGTIGGRDVSHQGSITVRGPNGRSSFGDRSGRSSTQLWLPPCPSYWAKGQFDRLTPRGLADVLDLLYEPARFRELARLVTRASDDGPINRSCSTAWDCVRQTEGPALGRALRRALSATLVSAGEFNPLPRVPPPPPAYLPRERLAEQVEATILHPFLPLGIAGIGGPSGSGKTALAAAVVRGSALRRRFGDRVFWLHAGKGAHRRLISIVQSLADTVYAWLTKSEKETGRGTGGGRGRGDLAHSEPREPIRFRDEEQAVQYVADLCQGPWLAGRGLRCLVVLDDIHEQPVVKALWKSQCQLLVISSVPGLLEAVGAEATMAEPFSAVDARKVAAEAAGEVAFCEDGAKLLELCRGCPLAVAMSGALAQAVIHTGSNAGNDWRTRSRSSRNGSSEKSGENGGGGTASSGSGTWSLGIGNTLSTLTAPVGAWMEQVVGTSSPEKRLAVGAGGSGAGGGSSGRGGGASGLPSHQLEQGGREGVMATTGRPGPRGMAWTEVTEKVHMTLAALDSNRTLRQLLVEGMPEEFPVRAMLVVLTQVALAEADHILGGSGIATRCYLSFALLPEGFPLPPPALEDLWRTEESGAGSRSGSRGRSQDEPSVVEVLEALRLLGRAGGGEGAAGLAPHGLQRRMILAMATDYPDVMSKLVRRRVRILSRVSSLVGTYDDGCWALGGSEDQRDRADDDGGLRGGGGGGGVGGQGGRARAPGGRGGGRRDAWSTQRTGEESQKDRIPTELLGSGPGPPSHGYGGFSRYDYLVASWGVLPSSHALASAPSWYLESVRTGCVASQNIAGRSGGWAVARALASIADLLALANRGSDAIPVYEEACGLLAAEAARNIQARGLSRWQRSARDALHKVANMVRDLALLAGQLRKEVPAIRLLQRAIEIHLSVLAAGGALVPDVSGLPAANGGDDSSFRQGSNLDISVAGRDDSDVEEAARLMEVEKGRGAGITWKAVANDDRPLRLRLRLQPVQETGEPVPAGRSGGGLSGGGAGGGSGIGGGILPPYGRLDVVATCIGDLGLMVSCTRQLRQAKRIDESVQLAEKVHPVLKEILGAEHAFTKAALAGFAGQSVANESRSQQGSAPTGATAVSHALIDVPGPGQHPSLPSPTSRRRLARNHEGRGVGGTLGSSEKKGSPAMAPSAASALSSPPSPLPREFYTRPSTSSVPVSTPAVAPVGESTSLRDGADRRAYSFASSAGHGELMGGRYSFGCASSSSGSDADEGEESDGASRAVGTLLGSRRGARIGRESLGILSLRRSTNRALPGWQRDTHGAWYYHGDDGTSVIGRRGELHPASTLLQHDRYIRHLMRRARAHAYLVTAATRARLKDADRARAGLFLLDRAREAGATAMEDVSPDGGGPQMPRLIAWRR